MTKSRVRQVLGIILIIVAVILGGTAGVDAALYLYPHMSGLKVIYFLPLCFCAAAFVVGALPFIGALSMFYDGVGDKERYDDEP